MDVNSQILYAEMKLAKLEKKESTKKKHIM